MKWKAVIGILLAVVSLLGLYLWETRFEDELTLTPVLVLSKDFAAGETVDLSDMQILRINPDSKLEGSLTQSSASNIAGKVLNRSIVKNQQLLEGYFIDKQDVIPEGFVNFVLPADWIYSKSILINTKDTASVYAMPDRMLLGTYKVASMYDGNVEIIARLEDYFKIYEAMTATDNKLLLVMEEDV